MPKQVITLHHFDKNTEDRAQNFSRYFIPPIIWLTIFASIVQSAMDATAKFAMLTASASALIFYSGIIVTGVWFAFGFTKSGIGFLKTNFKWLMAIRSVFGCLGSKPVLCHTVVWVYLPLCLLLLFGRWLTIYLINFISVHLMTAIFNLQFVWFVIIGYVVFSDVPSDVVWIGAIVLIGATTAVALCEYRESKER